MEFRRLSREEHGRTRRLYQEAFPEDGPRFTDYYYQWKTRDNVIFAALDGERVCGMVHLNPFVFQIRGQRRSLHYLVAVATAGEYRRQGIMRRLLALSEAYLKELEEPFAFLMPAKEEIYKPFGYRFFCSQRQGVLLGNGPADPALTCRPVPEEEYEALASFVNRTLSEEGAVFVWRDRAYYTRLAREQEAQKGAVMGIYRKAHLLGSFCTAREKGNPEIREVIYPKEYAEMAAEALGGFAFREGDCRVAGCPESLPLERERRTPLYMGKVLEEKAAESQEAFAGLSWFVNETV